MNVDTDAWRGIKRGDRFYLCGWNAQYETRLWYEVTDLWFDPVRGQHTPKRGYMVAVRLMGDGEKHTLSAATIAGKTYRRVEIAHENAEADLNGWMKALP